jgi:hypothetical protein
MFIKSKETTMAKRKENKIDWTAVKMLLMLVGGAVAVFFMKWGQKI